MLYTSAFLTLVAASLAAAQSFVVNSATGALTQCQPYSITWTGGQAPYFPAITEAGNVANVLKRFPQTPSMSQLWTVDLPVGMQVTFAVTDSSGTTQGSAPSTPILAGSSNDCLNSSTSAEPVGGVSTPAGASSTASTGPSSSASSSSATASSSSSVSRSSSSSSSTKSGTSSAQTPANTSQPDDNAAMNLRSGAALAAGLVGIVAAALI